MMSWCGCNTPRPADLTDSRGSPSSGRRGDSVGNTRLCYIILQDERQDDLNGGYDEGYRNCNCFWGYSPGSLVTAYLSRSPINHGVRVLDLGCGEGKNAIALASSGAAVTAVDISSHALANACRTFPDQPITWVESDAVQYLQRCELFDLIIMYGLLHCLPDFATQKHLVRSAVQHTTNGGHHLVVSFNDGPHDLRAHPDFAPTLTSHKTLLSLYSDQTIQSSENALIHETHPHNGIPHYHSITRMVVEISLV